MNQTVNQEWTSSEREKARSIITRFKRNDCSTNDINDANKKNHDIMGELHSWFPWKTMQQVKDLYVDLVVDMLTVQCEEEYDGVIGQHGIINTVDGLVNDNFVVQEEASMDGMDIFFGNPFDVMNVMDTEVMPAVEQNEVGMLENKMPFHPPLDAPHTRRFWTAEEHRLFLCGLCAFGRGKWKSISKYFITTRTPVQISSHAQKYFKKLGSQGLGKQRYSINDVELVDVNQWEMKNNSSAQQATAFADAGYDNPNFVLQTTLSNIAPFEFPLSMEVNRQTMWNEKHMMVPVTAPIEGPENFFPTSDQGSD